MAVSDDGTQVAFISAADGMAPGIDPRFDHVFVKHRATGQITPIAPLANGGSSSPSISDSGTRVAFLSTATNLAPGDTTPDADAYLADLTTGTITLLTPGTTQDVRDPVLAGNGQFAAFVTRESLQAADDNVNKSDVYRVAANGTGTTLVSRAAAVVGNGDSSGPSITDTGALVAFASSATNLVGGDVDTDSDVYVRNVAGAATTLMSRNSGGVNSANGAAWEPKIAGNGVTVAYTSSATDAGVGGDADADDTSDVYRVPVAAGTPVTLMSRATGAAGANADRSVLLGSISDDGEAVAFSTSATNLGVPAAPFTAYVRNGTSTTSPFAPSRAEHVAVSGDRSYVAAYVTDDLLGTGSPNSVTGATIPGGVRDLVSAPPGGPLVPRFLDVSYAYHEGPGAIMSADGRYVVFASRSPALPPATTGDQSRCFRRDLRTGEVLLISGGAAEPSACEDPTISADGTRVAFRAPAALVPDGVLGTFDVFVRDLTTGALTVASRADGATGARPDAYVSNAQMSADGRRVAFLTAATNLGSASGHVHLYVRDLAAGTTVIADRATGPAGAIGNAGAESIAIDADGSRVAFSSTATNLGDGDADATRDIFVRDVDAATTQLVSRRSDSDGGAKSANLSATPWISGDGDTVVFRSYGQNLDTSMGAWPATPQLVERDLVARTTRVVSREGAGGAFANASLGPASLSHDGTRLAYEARPPGAGGALGLPIPEGGTGIVLRDLTTGTQSLVAASVVDGTGAAQGSRAPALSADASCLAFVDRTADLVPGVSPDYDQLFVRVLSGDCGTTTPGVPGPGPGPAPGPGTVAQTPAPRLTKVSLLRSRFRVGPRATAKTAAVKRRRTPAGTAFRFTLDRTATMRFVIERRTTGRRVGTTCRKATAKLRRRKACVRYVKVGTISRRSLKAGRRSVAFSGRIGKQRLRVGRYRVGLQATGSTGRRSSTIRRAFRVVAR